MVDDNPWKNDGMKIRRTDTTFFVSTKKLYRLVYGGGQVKADLEIIIMNKTI